MNTFGINIIESPYCPEEYAYWISPNDVVVFDLTVMVVDEIFKHFEFDEAIERLKKFYLRKLYRNIETKFKGLEQ